MELPPPEVELAAQRDKIERKLKGARRHYESCTDSAKRQRMENNCKALERELSQLDRGSAAPEHEDQRSVEAAATSSTGAGSAQGRSAAAVHGLAEPRVMTSAEDKLLDTYRNLKDDKAASRKGLCIVEGPESIRMLLRSGLEVVSLFVKPTIFDKLAGDLAERERRTGQPISAMVAPHQLMGSVVGYSINRGALAAATVPTGRDLAWLRQNVLRDDRASWRVLAIDTTYDAANLGGMIRSASAFGVDALLLSDDSCDAWYRRSVRVSMGHIFRVPVVRCVDLAATLRELQDSAGLRSYAAVIDADAPRMGSPLVPAPPARWCVVFGNEDTGVRGPIRELCADHRVRINMAPGVDSLNIGVATGILLHWFADSDGRPGWLGEDG